MAIGTWGDPYRIPAGAHSISAVVDDVFSVVESNESNNTWSQALAADQSFVQNASAEEDGNGGRCGATGLEALLALALAAICRVGGSCRRSRP